MTPEDKQRIRDAFNRAFARNPEGADAPIEGMASPAGGTLSSRQLLENALASDDLFNVVDTVVATGRKSVDEFVADFEKTEFPFRLPPPGPRR
jgi:hypothetical protein